MHRFLGTVLSTLPFQEEQQIATLFSPDGILKLFLTQRYAALTLSFTEGEFLCTLGKGTLYRLREGSILFQHLRLRERLENLEAAGLLAQAVLKSQWPGKAAPALYHLFSSLLRSIPDQEDPSLVASLFQVKTWKHEGVLQQTNRCSLCDQLPRWRFGGERFCHDHAPLHALSLNEEEEEELRLLAEGRSLRQLLAHPIRIKEKIARLFDQTFS